MRSLKSKNKEAVLLLSNLVVGKALLEKASGGRILPGNLVWDMGLLCKILD